MEPVPFAPSPLVCAMGALARAQKVADRLYGDPGEIDALRAIAEIAERVGNIKRARTSDGISREDIRRTLLAILEENAATGPEPG